MKKRYKLLAVLTAWQMLFYYGIYIGWESDRSHEPNMKPWIGRSFQLDEPIFMYRTDGWYHELEIPRYDGQLPNDLDEFRAHPTEYGSTTFSSLYLLEPGTKFKIIKIVNSSTWVVGPYLDIKAIILSGPQADKKVLVTYLFDRNFKEKNISGPKSGILITQLAD